MWLPSPAPILLHPVVLDDPVNMPDEHAEAQRCVAHSGLPPLCAITVVPVETPPVAEEPPWHVPPGAGIDLPHYEANVITVGCDPQPRVDWWCVEPAVAEKPQWAFLHLDSLPFEATVGCDPRPRKQRFVKPAVAEKWWQVFPEGADGQWNPEEWRLVHDLRRATTGSPAGQRLYTRSDESPGAEPWWRSVADDLDAKKRSSPRALPNAVPPHESDEIRLSGNMVISHCAGPSTALSQEIVDARARRSNVSAEPVVVSFDSEDDAALVWPTEPVPGVRFADLPGPLAFAELRRTFKSSMADAWRPFSIWEKSPFQHASRRGRESHSWRKEEGRVEYSAWCCSLGFVEWRGREPFRLFKSDHADAWTDYDREIEAEMRMQRRDPESERPVAQDPSRLLSEQGNTDLTHQAVGFRTLGSPVPAPLDPSVGGDFAPASRAADILEELAN